MDPIQREAAPQVEEEVKVKKSLEKINNKTLEKATEEGKKKLIEAYPLPTPKQPRRVSFSISAPMPKQPPLARANSTPQPGKS